MAAKVYLPRPPPLRSSTPQRISQESKFLSRATFGKPSCWVSREFVACTTGFPRSSQLGSQIYTSAQPPRSEGVPVSEGNKSEEKFRVTTNEIDSANSLSKFDTTAPRGKRRAESTDWISSQLTKRFGLGEQVKTRLEVAKEEADAKDVEYEPVELPGGIQFQELRTGGGRVPVKGDLVVLDFRLMVNGEVIEDTFKRGKPIVFPFRSRPFTGGMNAGVETALSSMRAGGRAICTVPSTLGFGSENYTIRNTRHAGDKDAVIPANSDLTYELYLVRVSIPPS